MPANSIGAKAFGLSWLGSDVPRREQLGEGAIKQLRHYREVAFHDEGDLGYHSCEICGKEKVASDLVELAGFRALRTIVKMRQLPDGMTYVGAITIPLANCSYVIKVQCEERGVTGVREAVLLDRKLRGGRTIEAALKEIATEADGAEHDPSFPDHPVARARKHLQTVQTCVRVDERLRTAKPFGLP